MCRENRIRRIRGFIYYYYYYSLPIPRRVSEEAEVLSSGDGDGPHL
jgi:hypothetical protein